MVAAKSDLQEELAGWGFLPGEGISNREKRNAMAKF